MRFLFGGVAEVGHDIGATAFDFASPGNQDTLILDHPPTGSLNNSVFFDGEPLNAKLELGGLAFDDLNLIPNSDGVLTIVQLTNHGSPVYKLTNMQWGGTLSVGHGPDPQTGYDYLVYQAAPH